MAMSAEQNIDLIQTAEYRAFAREELLYNVTEDLLVIMEDSDISKKELARRLGKSRSYVTQVLSGSRNMTLGSFSDICFALGVKPQIHLPVKQASEMIIKKEPIDFHWINQEPSRLQQPKIVNTFSNVIDKRDPLLWDRVA